MNELVCWISWCGEWAGVMNELVWWMCWCGEWAGVMNELVRWMSLCDELVGVQAGEPPHGCGLQVWPPPHSGRTPWHQVSGLLNLKDRLYHHPEFGFRFPLWRLKEKHSEKRKSQLLISSFEGMACVMYMYYRFWCLYTKQTVFTLTHIVQCALCLYLEN